MNLELAEILPLHKVFIIIVWLNLLEEFAVTILKDPLQLLGVLPACGWVAWHLLMMDYIWWLKVTLLDIQGHWPPLAGTAMIEMEGQEYIVIDIEHWLMRLVSMINLTLRYLWVSSLKSFVLVSNDWKHTCHVNVFYPGSIIAI